MDGFAGTLRAMQSQSMLTIVMVKLRYDCGILHIYGIAPGGMLGGVCHAGLVALIAEPAGQQRMTDPAGKGPAIEGRIFAPAQALVGLINPLGLRIQNGDIGDMAGRQLAGCFTDDAGRMTGTATDQGFQRDNVIGSQLQNKGQESIHGAHTGLCFCEWSELGIRLMWLVI